MKEQQYTHILTPFNGMHSGYSHDGISGAYSAQVTTIHGICDFCPQNNASEPPYTFGYIQMYYNQSSNNNFIQVRFSLPQNLDVTIILSIEINVENSSFNFILNGGAPVTKPAEKNLPIVVTFKGTPNGAYDLLIIPKYIDSSSFLISKIEIYNGER